MPGGVVLRPFGRDQLRLVEPWFSDAETNRWLGGPDWPASMLDVAERPGLEYRGKIRTGAFRWLAWAGDRPVGYIDCGTFDRWTAWEGGPGGRGLLKTIDVPSGVTCYVVDPTQRRRSYGTAMLKALGDQPELGHVELIEAGIEPANLASVRTAAKAGFSPLDPNPDFEGIVYFVWRRSARVRKTA